MATNLGFVPSGAPAGSGAGASPTATPSANSFGFVPAAGQSPATAPTSQTGAPVNATDASASNQSNGDPFQSTLNSVSVPTLFPSSPDDSQTAAGLKTAGNFVGSAVNFGLGIAKMPFQAVHDIGADISGFNDAAQNFGGGISGYLTAAKTLAENLPGAAYKALVPQSAQQVISGDYTGAGNTIENDPVGQVLPYLLLGREAAYKVSPEAGAAFDSAITKTAAPVEAVASKVGSAASGAAGFVGDVGRFFTGQATGLFPQTIQTITDNPGSFSSEGKAVMTRGSLGDEIQSGMRAKLSSAGVTDASIASDLQSALDQREQDLSESGKGYGGVRQSGQIIPVQPEYLKNLIESKTGLTVSGDGTAPNPFEIKTTGEASLRNPGDLSALQSKIINVWQPEFAKGYLTANEFLNLRSDLGGMAKYEGGIGKSSPLENLSNVMRGQLNTDYRGNFKTPELTPDDLEEWKGSNPGKTSPKTLAELDANFASQASELKDLKKGLVGDDGKITDAGLGKIARATAERPNFAAKLEDISPGIMKKIGILRDVRDLGRGLVDNEGNLTESALNKIANATGKGKDLILQRLEQISPGIGQKITILKAIEDIENAEGQKVGTYARTSKELLAGGAGFAAAGPVGAVAAAIVQAILASPSVAVPILRAYGFSGDLVSAVVGKLKAAAAAVNQSTVGAGSISSLFPSRTTTAP